MSFRTFNIEVKRSYISLAGDDKPEDFPDSFWQTDVQKCELVRESHEDIWKVNFCGYIIEDW